MAVFSSGEIGRMICDKRYEVKQGDTLSELSESFMEAFPTLNRFSRSNVEDMIFDENKHAFAQNNKNLLLSDQYLKLNFILEARRREFKFDREAEGYVFTDEDRLAYGLNESGFWEDFCQCDRESGEFLRESMKEQGLSSLPKTMSLKRKISDTCCHKELMENVKREVSSFKKVVTLDVVAEKILKNIGFASPSGPQIGDLSEKLTEENGLNACKDERCICIAVDQIEKLSTKCVEEMYKKSPLTSEDERNLELGFYVLKRIDIDLAKNNKDLFWEKILKDSSERNNTLNARSKAGYTNDISTLRAGKKIAVASDKAIRKEQSQDDKSFEKLQLISKICGASLPSEFTQKMAVAVLMENIELKELMKLEKKDWERLELLSDRKKWEMKNILENIYDRITK